MNLRKLHKTFITGKGLLIVTILIFLAFRFWEGRGVSAWIFYGTTLAQIGIAFFLLYMVQTFSIIRHRTFLPAFFFLLIMGTNPALFFSLQGTVSLIILVFCLFFLFASYHKPDSQFNSFNIGFLLTLGSLYWMPLLFFFPLFWYGMYLFKSLNFRTFLAGIIGFLAVYFFLFTWSVYQDNLSIFLSKRFEFMNLFYLDELYFSVEEWFLIGFTGLLMIASGINIFMSGIAEKIQAMITLSFLYLFSIVGFVLLFLQSYQKAEWMMILTLPISILIAHFFTLYKTKANIYFLFITIAFYLGMFVWMMVGDYF